MSLRSDNPREDEHVACGWSTLTVLIGANRSVSPRERPGLG